MRIVVSTDSLFSAACLKVEILKAIKGENPEPSWEIKSLHAGRLVEMLMSHFNEEFVSFKIIDFN